MIRKIALLFVLAAILASCGASRNTTSSKSTALQNQVIQYGKKHIGKPYRYAAKGPRSFDCSGFTSYVFRQFGYNLSPSSAGQDQQVPSIRRKSDLKKGDLVFFEGRSHNGRVGHVGIVSNVNSNGTFEFIHASTSRGVIISKSTEPYYNSRYLRGGRVLNDTNTRKEVVKESRHVASTHKGSKKADKRANAYKPATAKKGQEQERAPIVPIVTPEEDERSYADLIIQDENSKAVVEAIATEKQPEQVIIVQTDSIKNIELPVSSIEEHQQKEKQNDTIQSINFDAVIRNDSTLLPQPSIQPIEKDSVYVSTPTEHTVKMGETFYSICKQYDCTIEQLREWNPLLGQTLKAGDKISIYRQH